MIQFQQVAKKYPGNDFALGEINLQIEDGEFVFFIGPSGSGKTTLIRLLIREEDPTAGKIFFDDVDVTRLSRSNVYRLRRQLGVIFQDYKLIPDKNAYENVAFAMEAAGRTNKDIKETVPYVLDIVGLSNRMNAFPEQLSGGEKQRVAIARAVANNPRVLIADEPTGNLDPAAAWDIVQILSKINNWGTTVIMSTHGSDIVNTLNKRVVQMKHGQVVRDDAKGAYERTDWDKVMTEPNLDNEEEPHKEGSERKGPIKVKLKKAEIPGTTASRHKFLKWFGVGSGEEKTHESVKSGILQTSEVQSQLAEEAEERAELLEDIEVTEKEAEQIMRDAASIDVAELDLRPEVVADLQTAGYITVQDIIDAGPDQLAAELIIDPEEVVLIAQAVSEFVAEEDNQLETGKNKGEHERAPRDESKESPQPGLTAGRGEKKEEKKKQPKLDLTGKK